jgi:hypothetical protein
MMVLNTSQELDELYSIYKALIRKEIQCTDALLETEDLEEKKELASQAMRYSKEASAVARAIKEIEDNPE